MDTSQIIKKLRRDKNYTQEFVAEKLGVSKAAVSLYEKGESALTLEKINQYAELFQVDPSSLLGNKEEKVTVSSKTDELVEEFRATIDFMKTQIGVMNEQNQHLRELLELALKGNFPGGSEATSTGLKKSDFSPLKLVA